MEVFKKSNPRRVKGVVISPGVVVPPEIDDTPRKIPCHVCIVYRAVPVVVDKEERVHGRDPLFGVVVDVVLAVRGCKLELDLAAAWARGDDPYGKLPRLLVPAHEVAPLADGEVAGRADARLKQEFGRTPCVLALLPLRQPERDVAARLLERHPHHAVGEEHVRLEDD